MNRKPQLIVALDVDNLKEARRLVNLLYPQVKIFKVGSQLFTAEGPEAVRMIRSKGAQVFLDLKFHDIPSTVANAVTQATALSIFMMTAHIKGGKEMLEAVVRGAREKAAGLRIKRPFIVGITRLTSDKGEINTEQEVLEAAKLAKDAGLDGVVCSVQEARSVRKECDSDFLIVTPGIRPKGYTPDDQSRIATAKEAVDAGSDYLVVGRPIIKAKQPLRVAQDIISEIS